MANHHEDRFARYLRFLLPAQDAGQQVSIPRAARRLDFAFAMDRPHPLFGAAVPLLQGRAVIFEHESAAADEVSLRSAEAGRAWLVWRWSMVNGTPTRRADAEADELWMDRHALRPVVVVLAHGVQSNALEAFIDMVRIADGVWRTRDFFHTGLLVIDTHITPCQDGWSLWRYIGACRSREDFQTRLDALLDDPNLPMLRRVQLKEDIAMEKIETSADERETVVQRIEREGHAKGLVAGLEAGREQGLKEGREEGREEGRRQLLLHQAALLLPEDYARLAVIDETDALEREVMGLLMRRQ